LPKAYVIKAKVTQSSSAVTLKVSRRV